ncbi:SipW-dependent-type signal peptide-containing protein [Rhodococcus sp. ACT016]|uniref:SipW-dependent-type signal peptide-containing protein n=1 Tax=Rhodococcus sp. ACT016 TaxID=3134808 RepID=UPI003D27AF9C
MSRDEISNSTPTVGARMRKALGGGRVRAALSLGIVLGLGSVGTLAAWSDTATATSGMFSTATVDLQLNDNPGNPTAYAFTNLTKSGMMPGEFAQATLPVQNKGATVFKYTMSATAAGDSGLAPLMKVTVLESTCTTAIAGPLGLSTTASTPIITTGRELAASTGVEMLCLRVTLDPAVSMAMQNKTLNVSFAFAATTA